MIFYILGIVLFLISGAFYASKWRLYCLYEKAKGKYYAARDKCNALDKFILEHYNLSCLRWDTIEYATEAIEKSQLSDERKKEAADYAKEYVALCSKRYKANKQADNAYDKWNKLDDKKTFPTILFFIGLGFLLISLSFTLVCLNDEVINSARYETYVNGPTPVYGKNLEEYNSYISSIKQFKEKHPLLSYRTKKGVEKLKLITNEDMEKIEFEGRINTVPYLKYERK